MQGYRAGAGGVYGELEEIAAMNEQESEAMNDDVTNQNENQY